MRIERLDIVVGVIAGLTCLGLLINIPVWALFIGWTWYFVLGSEPKAFKQSIPAMIEGYVLAAISIIVYTLSGYNIVAIILAVAITVFVLMLSLKITMFSCSMASFNAYSCLFAGYYAGAFPKTQSVSAADWKNVCIAIVWIAMANIIGLICGWLSIKFGVTKK